MFKTNHYRAFDKWWRYAEKNYLSSKEGKPVGLDLYYDPTVDEHVLHGIVGMMAPTWYFAPQKHEVALAGWHATAMLSRVFDDAPMTGLDEPSKVTSLLQFAGEFADAATKERIWAAADEHIQPTWDSDKGEFTLGFGLNEAHPRGQMNARAMAGWVCTPGAWSRLFNEPNLTKFDEPTVDGVDFPSVALSEARWDGKALHIAAHPQNAAMRGNTSTMRITNIDLKVAWQMVPANGQAVTLNVTGDHINVELVVDNRPVIIRPC